MPWGNRKLPVFIFSGLVDRMFCTVNVWNITSSNYQSKMVAYPSLSWRRLPQIQTLSEAQIPTMYHQGFYFCLTFS